MIERAGETGERSELSDDSPIHSGIRRARSSCVRISACRRDDSAKFHALRFSLSAVVHRLPASSLLNVPLAWAVGFAEHAEQLGRTLRRTAAPSPTSQRLSRAAQTSHDLCPDSGIYIHTSVHVSNFIGMLVSRTSEPTFILVAS